MELAERGADDVCEPVRDVIGLGIAAEVSERENGDANFLNWGNRRVKPAVKTKRESTHNPESENGDDDALPWRRRNRFGRIDDRRSYGHVNWGGHRSACFGVRNIRAGISIRRIGLG